MISKPIFVSMVVMLSLVQFITCSEPDTHHHRYHNHHHHHHVQSQSEPNVEQCFDVNGPTTVEVPKVEGIPLAEQNEENVEAAIREKEDVLTEQNMTPVIQNLQNPDTQFSHALEAEESVPTEPNMIPNIQEPNTEFVQAPRNEESPATSPQEPATNNE